MASLSGISIALVVFLEAAKLRGGLQAARLDCILGVAHSKRCIRRLELHRARATMAKAVETRKTRKIERESIDVGRLEIGINTSWQF